MSRVRLTLIGQRHFIVCCNPKRERGIELRKIPRSRFGLQKHSDSLKCGAVQLIDRQSFFHANTADFRQDTFDDCRVSGDRDELCQIHDHVDNPG